MKKAIAIILVLVIWLAGFGAGLYTMYLKMEPAIFAWAENAHNWQYQAERNEVAAEYYRENAEINAYVAEVLRELYDRQAVEVETLEDGIRQLEEFINKELNEEWINY